MTDNFVRIFYSFISGSDAGRIKMLYQNQINILQKIQKLYKDFCQRK